jgi:hypothetical protein
MFHQGAQVVRLSLPEVYQVTINLKTTTEEVTQIMLA